MTGPLGFGYQDWGRSFATSRFFELPFLLTTITEQTTVGPYVTGNIDSLGIRCSAITNHGQIRLSWSQDEAGAFPITDDIISIRQGATFDQSIVVKGPFLRIIASNVEPADWQLTLIIYETTRSVIPQHTAVANILFSNTTIAVAAGASATNAITRVWAGEISWQATSSLATWTARIEAIDETGALTSVDFMSNASPLSRRQVFLPSCSCQVVVQNTTGAAGSIGVRMSARPGISGM